MEEDGEDDNTLQTISLPAASIKRIAKSAAPGVSFNAEALAGLHRIAQAFVCYATDRSLAEVRHEVERGRRGTKARSLPPPRKVLGADHVMRFLHTSLPPVANKVAQLFPDLMPFEHKPAGVQLLEQLHEQRRAERAAVVEQARSAAAEQPSGGVPFTFGAWARGQSGGPDGEAREADAAAEPAPEPARTAEAEAEAAPAEAPEAEAPSSRPAFDDMQDAQQPDSLGMPQEAEPSSKTASRRRPRADAAQDAAAEKEPKRPRSGNKADASTGASKAPPPAPVPLTRFFGCPRPVAAAPATAAPTAPPPAQQSGGNANPSGASDVKTELLDDTAAQSTVPGEPFQATELMADSREATRPDSVELRGEEWPADPPSPAAVAL